MADHANSTPVSGFPIITEGLIGATVVQTVNARNLHTYLDNGDHFATWVKARIAKYGFVENVDFLTVSEITETVKDGKTYRSQKVEYHMSIDMAKELAMVENNDKGREARRYFIECERLLKEAEKSLSPAEILIAQGKAMLAVEKRQAALAAMQQVHEHKIAETERRLNQIETATDYFTVIGYARWTKKTSVDLKTAAEVGRHATRRANQLGVKIGKIPDPRFGAVSQYPKAVLDFVWDEIFASGVQGRA